MSRSFQKNTTLSPEAWPDLTNPFIFITISTKETHRKAAIHLKKLTAAKRRVIHRKGLIMELIRSHGHLSKNNLYKLLEYSISTIISTVDDMYREGIICKDGISNSSVGRPAVYYTLNADYGYTIGIDINAGSIHLVLINLKRETVCSVSDSFSQPKITLAEITQRVLEMLDEILRSFSKRPRILCIGVSAPGLIDIHSGKILYYSYFPNEQQFPIVEILSERYNCPIYIEKSLNCLAVAFMEHSNKEARDIILVSIRTGVGMSFLLNGSIYRGHTGQAGEIGHLRLPNSTSVCKCGKIGCLDSEVSIYAIIKKMDALLGKTTGDDNQKLSAAVKIAKFVEFVNANQPDCVHILDEICYFLGYAVSQLINLFNPSDILFYGEITQCGQIFLDHLEKYVDINHLTPNFQPANLSIVDLSNYAFADGAAYYALDTLISNAPHLGQIMTSQTE